MYPLKIGVKYDPLKAEENQAIFTTVYRGNYIPWDFREWVGSHTGVDIVPPQPGADVLAVLPGIVQTAESRGDFGKFIVIAHQVPAKYFSCYLHLSEILVTPGSLVNEGDIIGKTGNTGLSTGEHLHFQIDTDRGSTHPFFPFTAAEAKEKGLSYLEAVNAGLGQEKIAEHTENPLLFLDEMVTSPNFSKKNEKILAQNKEEESEILLTSPFQDVTIDDPDFPFIVLLRNEKIMTGFQNRFSPDQNLSRGEAVKSLVTWKGKKSKPPTISRFVDLQKWDDFFWEIHEAVSRGWIRGYNDQTFRPNRWLSRGEALCILSRVFDQKNANPSDIEYQTLLFWLQNKEATLFETSDISPEKEISRREFARILAQIIMFS